MASAASAAGSSASATVARLYNSEGFMHKEKIMKKMLALIALLSGTASAAKDRKSVV